MVALVPVVEYGTSALIWPALTKCSGAALLLIRTVTPLSVAGYGGVPAWVLLARPVPYSEMNWPGAMGFPGGAKLAAFTTPRGFPRTPCAPRAKNPAVSARSPGVRLRMRKPQTWRQELSSSRHL